MACSEIIIDCLRSKKIEPEAFASSFQVNFKPSNALDSSTSSMFSSSLAAKEPQWWAVDFKHPVAIKKYSIRTRGASSGGNKLYNWTLSVSTNNLTWRVVHGPVQSYSALNTFDLAQEEKALYAKIDGDSLWYANKLSIVIEYIIFYGSLTQFAYITYNPKKKVDMNLILALILSN